MIHFYLRVLSFFVIILLSACSNEDELAQSQFSQDETGKYIIAHRGCWGGEDGYPQNSRAAFNKALGLNIYGVEFDVHQTIDGVLVVNHDYTFNGKDIAQCTYDDLSQSILSNGETIPRLEEFLEIRNDITTSVKIIVELKRCNVQKVVQMIEAFNLQDQTEFISFSLDYCLQLVELGYGQKTAYLGGDIAPSQIKNHGIGGIDYEISVYEQHPQYIIDAKELNLFVYVWTVNNLSKIRKYIEKGVVVTTDLTIDVTSNIVTDQNETSIWGIYKYLNHGGFFIKHPKGITYNVNGVPINEMTNKL